VAADWRLLFTAGKSYDSSRIFEICAFAKSASAVGSPLRQLPSRGCYSLAWAPYLLLRRIGLGDSMSPDITPAIDPAHSPEAQDVGASPGQSLLLRGFAAALTA
jgi:hypothetical protein